MTPAWLILWFCTAVAESDAPRTVYSSRIDGMLLPIPFAPGTAPARRIKMAISAEAEESERYQKAKAEAERIAAREAEAIILNFVRRQQEMKEEAKRQL